jgi:hypothetical protein
LRLLIIRVDVDVAVSETGGIAWNRLGEGNVLTDPDDPSCCLTGRVLRESLGHGSLEKLVLAL